MQSACSLGRARSARGLGKNFVSQKKQPRDEDHGKGHPKDIGSVHLKNPRKLNSMANGNLRSRNGRRFDARLKICKAVWWRKRLRATQVWLGHLRRFRHRCSISWDARSQSNMTGELLRWSRPRRRKMLDGDAHQFRQGTSAELGFELSAGIGYGLVAHMQVLGDNAVRFAFGQ